MQLYLFEESKEERLTREVQKLREQCENVRKGQFAKIADLMKVINETKTELEMLKSCLCRANNLASFLANSKQG
jgi:hypothetical protein